MTPLSAADVAEEIVWAANKPAHVNIAEVSAASACWLLPRGHADLAFFPSSGAHVPGEPSLAVPLSPPKQEVETNKRDLERQCNAFHILTSLSCVLNSSGDRDCRSNFQYYKVIIGKSGCLGFLLEQLGWLIDVFGREEPGAL